MTKEDIEVTEYETIESMEYIYIGITQVTDKNGVDWYRTEYINSIKETWQPYNNSGEKVEGKILKIRNPFKN